MTPTCQAWHKDRCLVWNHQIDQGRSIQQPNSLLNSLFFEPEKSKMNRWKRLKTRFSGAVNWGEASHPPTKAEGASKSHASERNIIVHRFGVKPTIVSNKTTSPCWVFYHEVASFVVGKTSMFVNSIFISMLNLRLYLLKPSFSVIPLVVNRISQFFF